jgi:cell division protein FtsQ
MEIYRRFLAELDGSGRQLSKSISEVDVSNPEDIKAMISSEGMDVLVHFGDQEFLDRYRKFEAHLPEWKTQYPKLGSADMRYESQIVLEMLPGTGVPVNTDKPSAAGDDPATPSTAPATGAPAIAAVHHEAAAIKPKPAAAPKPAGANARIFAALAAQHRAALAKAKGGSATR